MNPHSGDRRGISWDEAGPSRFGSPKRGRFHDMAGGAVSHTGVQQNHNHGSRVFHGDPCSDYDHQDGGWVRGSRGGSGGGAAVRGMRRGTGSTISRLMDLASGSGGDSGFAGYSNPSAGLYSQSGDSSFADYSGCNQHQQSSYGGGGGGMRGQGFRGRGSSVGGFGDPRGIRPFSFGSAAQGQGIGYEAAPRFGQSCGGFDIGGGYNQNQSSGDQRAGGHGGARGEYIQRGRLHGGERGRAGQTGHHGGDRGRGDAPRGSWKGMGSGCDRSHGDAPKGVGSMVSRLMDLASSDGSGFADSGNPSRGWWQGGDYGRGRGVGERGRGRGGDRGREKLGRSSGFADSGNPSKVGGQGGGEDHEQLRGVRECDRGKGGNRGKGGDRGKGGHRGREKVGHNSIVNTRPNGTTYYVRNEHSLLQNSSKFQEQQNQLPVLDRFLNLCESAKPLLNRPPRPGTASIMLEKLLLTDNVCLTPGYVFKGERIDDLQPFNFRCKVYIENIFMASGVALNRKDAKNKGCDTAIKVLGTKNPQIIITTHEKVNNVMELGKQDADIVECPFSSGESNVANILSVPESDVKKSRADLYILEPEELDKSTGMKSTLMNSTCILRQSADFSHLLLAYEFTTSAQGFLCTVSIEGEMVATGTATLRNTAKNLASHAALQNLRQTNWTIVIVKRDKPKPAATPLTATCGHILNNNAVSRQHFMDKLRAYLTNYFAGLADYTELLPLSSELNREERDAVYSVGKEMNLRVEARRIDGAKGNIGAKAPMFLVVSKKYFSPDLFDYVWEKGGETWRYKLKPPGEVTADIT